MLLLCEYEVNGPATADVRSSTSEVAKDIRVRTAGVFESIGEDGQLVKRPLLINLRSHFRDRTVLESQPEGDNVYPAKWVAN